MEKDAKAVFYQALDYPFTVLGIEKRLFCCLLALSLPLAFSAHFSWSGDLLALSVFAIGYRLAYFFTAYDPDFLYIYRRFLHYQSYYAAQPSLYRENPKTKHSVPLLPKV